MNQDYLHTKVEQSCVVSTYYLLVFYVVLFASSNCIVISI